MPLTVSLTYVVTERSGEAGYTINLARSDGFQLHQSQGATRELAIQGLLNFGFTVTESA